MDCRKNLKKIILPAVMLVSLNQAAFAASDEFSLAECITLALQNNSSVKIAGDNAQGSFWAVREAKGNQGISLSFKQTDTRSRSAAGSDGVGKPVSNLFTNQVILSLPLYSGGKYENLSDVAKLNYEIAGLNMAAVKQQIKFNTTSGYYGVLKYKNMVAADQASVDDYALHLKNLQISYEAGSASKLQVLQTQVSLANAQEALMKDKKNYEVALISLKNIMGLPQRDDMALKEDLKNEKYLLTLDECVKYALANRPEISICQTNVAIAADDVKVAKSGNLPSISLDGYQGWQDDQLPGKKNSYFSFYLTASYNIFDSGITDAKIKQAESALHKAQETAKQGNEAIYVEVSQYYLGMQEAGKRIDTSSVSVAEAEEVVRISKVRFTAGLGTNQDILDAEVALTTARNNYIQAMYDYNDNKAGLEAAMGVAVE